MGDLIARMQHATKKLTVYRDCPDNLIEDEVEEDLLKNIKRASFLTGVPIEQMEVESGTTQAADNVEEGRSTDS